LIDHLFELVALRSGKSCLHSLIPYPPSVRIGASIVKDKTDWNFTEVTRYRHDSSDTLDTGDLVLGFLKDLCGVGFQDSMQEKLK
jgi:hypothetical protein